MDFEEALSLARRGDEQGWRFIYRAHAPQVTGYLRARGAAEPEDLAGEVFLQVVRDLHRFEGGAPEFGAWVFSIAYHRLIDDARARRRRRTEAATDAAIETAGPVGDAQDEAIGLISKSEIRRMIESLTPDQRDVLLLRILGGMKVEEVAKTMGKRAGAVQALQRRGLATLRKELERKGFRAAID